MGSGVTEHGAERAHSWRDGAARVSGWLVVALVSAVALAASALLVVQIVAAATNALTPERREVAAGRVRTADAYLVSPAMMDSADAVVQRTVANRVVPGATVAIGERGRVIQMTGYGRVGWRPTDQAVSADSTEYDLASLTKAFATTSAVFLLVQDGKVHLDDPVQRWLPDFQGPGKDRVTWRHLLTHTSGLPPSGHMKGKTAAQRLESLLQTKLDAPPGQVVQYSDVSFIVLWAAAQRAAGEPLPRFLARRVWQPLGMTRTAFWPGEGCETCAPTMTLKSGEPYRGKPSDPIAHKLGIPAGNAGLFSTAHDLARFAAMIANGGALDGVRIFDADLVQQLFRQSPDAGHRTLGWEAFCPDEHFASQQQPCRHPVAYGHTGWTGTSIWIDPLRGVWVVILSNRSYDVTHPPSLEEFRADVFDRVAGGDDSSAVAH